MYYRPEIGRFHLRRLRRLHRKLVVIDARIAFVGGINIIDDNNAPIDMRPVSITPYGWKGRRCNRSTMPSAACGKPYRGPISSDAFASPRRPSRL
jgi:hypothetical protein